MPYRKGEITSRQIDRDYPHQIEILIPPGGLLGRLNDMARWCRLNVGTYHQRSLSHRERAALVERYGPDGPHDATRWCFAIQEEAEAFRAVWGDDTG